MIKTFDKKAPDKKPKAMSQFLTPLSHHHFDTTDSTNTQLICAIADGTHTATAHHLYTANHQTAGRGQHGRTWVSGADNVFLSLYTPIGQGEFELHTLSGLLSLAVGFCLANLPIISDINRHRTQKHLPPIGVKWANDLGFYDDALGIFKKLAGILIEPVFKKSPKSTLVGVVIGVGLNVQNAPVIKDRLYQATCLNELSKHPISTTAQDLYAPITNVILQAVALCNRCADSMYLQHFIDKFNTAHLLTDKFIHIFMQNNTTDIHAQGKCVGIGVSGELLLKNNDTLTPIFAGMAQIQKDI